MAPFPTRAMSLFSRLNLAAVVLCFGLVVLGAYVRLSNAGLGCPDWPGCYGQLTVPQAAPEIGRAEAAFPQRPVEAPKAWKEMVHRYLAGGVGLLILALTAWAWIARRPVRRLAAGIAGVLLVQIVFGALTVTLKVNPLIVTTHLLLGLTTLALLWWMWLATERGETIIDIERSGSVSPRAREARSERHVRFALESSESLLAATVDAPAPRGLRIFATIALVLLIGQIFLGGWTSTNYAALACPDFPTCHGSFLPKTELSRAFKLWHGHDLDYEYGILDVAARATVHLVHRYGAAILSATLLALAAFLLVPRAQPRWRRLGFGLLGALGVQVGIGIGLVEWQLPLGLADAHNAGAALLLLVLVAINFEARPAHGSGRAAAR